MTFLEAKGLLTFRQSMEGGEFGNADVEAWRTCLDDVGYVAALGAAVAHYRESTEPLKPAHIISRV